MTVYQEPAGQAPKIITREESERLINTIRNLAKGGGATGVRLVSWWNGELRWARNRVSVASDRRDIHVYVERHVGSAWSLATTNQTDDESLEAVVRAAERTALIRGATLRKGLVKERPSPRLAIPTPTIWSDHTNAVTAEQRASLSRTLVDASEAQGMLAAGYLEMRAGEEAVSGPVQEWRGWEWPATPIFYQQYTQAQCSMTVRHPKGVGSGWAGLSSFDWSAIDGGALAERALQKCTASLNPVAIEPGRYTIILEPQPVYELAFLFFVGLRNGPQNAWDRENPEMRGRGPFFLGPDIALRIGRSKLGLKVVDERITIDHNPLDPMLGMVPYPDLQPKAWIERGVLTSLDYTRRYALQRLNETHGSYARMTFRMSGGTTTMDEMLSTTKRGLLVTRFSNLAILDGNSLLATGVTRDGLWLVENGKITKAVKNMRITESPLFVLNQLEQLGVPVPVFAPVKDPATAELTPAIVPPLKANDFSFTSTVDAV